MKITNELSNRIHRQVEEKHIEEQENLKKIYEEQIKEKRQKLVIELEQFKSSPIGEILYKEIESRNYHRDNSLKDFVMNRQQSFFPEEYGNYQEKVSALRTKINLEQEELRIAISYEKTLDGIKDAFQNLGLTF